MSTKVHFSLRAQPANHPPETAPLCRNRPRADVVRLLATSLPAACRPTHPPGELWPQPHHPVPSPRHHHPSQMHQRLLQVARRPRDLAIIALTFCCSASIFDSYAGFCSSEAVAVCMCGVGRDEKAESRLHAHPGVALPTYCSQNLRACDLNVSASSSANEGGGRE